MPPFSVNQTALPVSFFVHLGGRRALRLLMQCFQVADEKTEAQRRGAEVSRVIQPHISGKAATAGFPPNPRSLFLQDSRNEECSFNSTLCL